MVISKTDFQNALREVVSSQFSHIPTSEDSINFEFSEKFIKRMERLIRSQKKAYWKFVNTASKRVAVLLIVLLTMITSALSVKAIREPVVIFFKEIYESFTQYLFEGDTTDEIKKVYAVTWLPDGFYQSDKIESNTAITTVYINGDNTIKFTQQTTNNAELFLDNENCATTSITISNFNVDIYEGENAKHAIWTKDGYFFKLTCMGDISIDSIKMMISSIK